MTELSCQVEKKKEKQNKTKPLSSAWTGLPCPSSSDDDILSEARRCGTLTEPQSPSRYQPLCCLRPYASAVPVSGIPLTTTATACLQNFRLLWYIPAYVCMLFSPIDNTWARSLFLFFLLLSFFSLTKGRRCHMHGRINEDLNWQHHLPNTLDVKRVAPAQHCARLSGGCHIVISANTKY